MSERERRAFVVYGNCQAQFLHLLLERIPWIADRFQVHLVTNTVEIGAQPEPLPHSASRAVLLWLQYDQRPQLPVRDELLQRIPDDCEIVRFPAVGLNAFWPFRMRDPLNRPEPAFPWGRYPLGDRLAMEVRKLGLTPERAYERYMERSYEQMPDVEHLLGFDRAVHTQRDAGSDLAMADFVFANLRDVHQFWTHGHLAISVVAELLSRLLARSSGSLGEMNDGVRAQIAAACAPFEGQGDVQLPLHPLVIERLGLRFADGTTRYRWFSQRWTFEEYMTRYIAFNCDWR